MESQIDLHVHTTASDGSFSPSEVVHLASALGLSAIAITDHDTVAGYPEAAEAASASGIEVIPGIEISTRYRSAVHILGYYVNQNNHTLQQSLNEIVEDRDRRNEKICALMREDGLAVRYDNLKKRFGTIIGRPHFARVLTELGLASDVQDAFRKYLEVGKPYFQRRNFLSIERSVELIVEAGGIPVLAHPFQYRLSDADLRNLIEHCIEYGLAGIECLYSGYSAEQSRYLSSLAAEYHLLITGGSDFHGSSKPHIQLGSGTGDLYVPYSLLERLNHENASHIPLV